jgi:hypothetical protein
MASVTLAWFARHEQFKFSIDVNFKHTTQHYKLYNYARYLSARDFCNVEVILSKNFSSIMNFIHKHKVSL